MWRVWLVVPCVALMACGSAAAPPSPDRSRLANGQTAAIIGGQPAIVDRDGAVVRTIELACRGFMLRGRLHKCTDPSVDSIAVSPDRRTLAYTRVLSGLEGLEPWSELGVIGVDGSRQRTVIKPRPSPAGGVSDVAWADDGQRVWFVYEQTLLESVRLDSRDRQALGPIAPRPVHDPPHPGGRPGP